MNEKNEEQKLTQKDNEESKNTDELKITGKSRKESSIKEDLFDSNKKELKRKVTRKSTLKRKLFERPEYIENILDKEILDEFDFLKIDPEIFKILVILTKKYKYRTEKENKLQYA